MQTESQEPGKLKYATLTDQIINAFYTVYNELGYGFLENTKMPWRPN